MSMRTTMETTFSIENVVTNKTKLLIQWTKCTSRWLGRDASSANETADSELLSGHTGLHGSLDKTTHQTLRWRPWGQQPPSQCTSSQYERDVSGRLYSHNPLIPTSNATVSTVGATSHHGSVVHLDVVDHQVLHVQSLRLAVRLQVVQEHQEELARRLGPSAQIAGSLH